MGIQFINASVISGLQIATYETITSRRIKVSQKFHTVVPAQTTRELLRIVRAAQPIPRVAVARRLGVHRRRVTVLVKPLIDSGILREGAPDRSVGVGRPPIGLSLRG